MVKKPLLGLGLLALFSGILLGFLVLGVLPLLLVYGARLVEDELELA